MKSAARGLFLIVAVLLVLLSQVGCDSTTPDEHIAEARDLIAAGEFRSATIELSNALQQDPNLVEARWLLAEVSLTMGDGAKAEKEINRALDLGLAPESGQLLLLKAIALQGETERLLAESDPIDLSVSNADRASILGLRGQAYAERRQFEAANNNLLEGLALDANSTPALVGMAIVKALQRDYDAAREWVDRAIEVDSSSPEAWSLLGQIELEQGNAAEAEEALSKAIDLREFPGIEFAKRAMARTQLDKFAEAESDIAVIKQAGLQNDSYVNYVAGVNLFRQQKYRDAADAFETSRVDSPSYLPREYYLASTYMMLGNFELARRSAATINTMAPKSLLARRLLGAVQINQSELDAATKVLSDALRDAPEDAILLRMLGYVALQVGDAAQAVGYYEKALMLEPDFTQAKNDLALAKLIAGQDLAIDPASSLSEAVTSDEAFVRDFINALAMFRDGRLRDALEHAEALHVKYPDNVEPLKLMAACYLRATQWDTAQSYLEQALQIKPNESSAARNLALLELRSGNPEEARKLLRGVVGEHPQDEEAALMLASVERSLEDEEAGLRVLEQALERNQSGLKVRLALAGAYLRTDRPGKALEATRDLETEDIKKMTPLIELRATAQMRTGDISSALISYRQWIDLDPESARAHFHYAESLTRAGDMKLANQELQRSLELDSGYLPARAGEIKMLTYDKEFAKADGRLQELRSEFGSRDDVLGIEGWFALGTGDYSTAVDRYATLLENQHDARLMILYVRSLWGQESYDLAIESMQQWLKEQPGDLAVGMQLAGAYLTLQRDNEARAAYANVVEHHPNHTPALNNLAWLNQNQNLEEAITYAERANELSPGDPAVMDTLGMLLVKHGDTARGQRLIRDAAERAPDDFNIQIHLAQTLAAEGKVVEAKTILERVIKLAGDQPAAALAQTALESLP